MRRLRHRRVIAARSLLSARTRRSGVRVEPVRDAPRVLDAVARLAAAREVVVVLGESDELRLDAVEAQGGEELLGLLDRAPEVALGMEDEERRFHLRRVG